jgi:predicted Fe-Mo cluster-binding NifX family protein
VVAGVAHGEARTNEDNVRDEEKGVRDMKIAVPLHEGRFCDHFGGAQAFAFYDVDGEQRSIEKQMFGAPPAHGRGIFPMWLKQQGATVVLAGGMGPRAVDIFERQGIEVVLGVEGDDPEVIAQRYLAGTLETTGEVCHEHGYHDCGHDHGQGEGRHD